MAEKTIAHLIEITQAENAESRGIQEDTRDNVAVLTKMFGKYFKQLKNQEGDKLEAEREKKKEKEAPLPNIGDALKDAKGLGFFGMLGAITAAISGLVVGIVEGLVKAIRLVGGGILKTFKTLTKSILRLPWVALRKLGQIFLPNFTKKVRVRIRAMRMALNRGLKKLTDTVNRLKNWIKDIPKRIAGFFKTAKLIIVLGFQMFTQMLADKIKGIGTKIGNLAWVQKTKEVFKGVTDKIKTIFGKIRSVMSFLMTPFKPFLEDAKDLRKQIGTTTKKSGGIIQKIKDGFKTIGDNFKKFSGMFSKVFGFFRKFGRVSGPIAIIFSLIDAFNGMIDGFKTDGIVGGVFGAISGFLQGFVGIPLDLMKSIISWAAEKMGFENFSEMLDSFSFTDMIGSLFSSITDVVGGFIDSIINDFQNMSFMDFVGSIIKKIVNIFTGIAKFPVAVAAGGAAALGAMVPGGKSPGEAFGDAFDAVMNFGKMEDKSLDTAIEARQEDTKKHELEKANKKLEEESGETIARKTTEEKQASQQLQQEVAVNQNIVNSSTVNNTSSNVQYNEPSGALDVQDGLSRSSQPFVLGYG